MSNRYIISETEKERILGLHEQASSANPLAPGNALSNSTLPTGTIKPPPTTTSPATTIGDKLYQALISLKTNDPINNGLVDKVITILSRPDVKVDLTDKISTFKTSDELNLNLSSFTNSAKPDEQKMAELIKKAVYIIRPDLKSPTTPVASQPIQLGVVNPKVTAIQELLNTKYKAGLVPDGKWGPKTATALKKAIDSKKSAVVTPTSVGDVSGTVATQTNIS